MYKELNVPTISRRVGDEAARDLVLSFLAELDSPRSLTVAMLYFHGEFKQILQLTCDPHDYNCPEEFRSAYCATKLLSKTDNLPVDIDREAVAIAKAFEAERQCHLTNQRIRASRRPGLHGEALNLLLWDVKERVRTILGPLPTSFIEVGWTKGRTTSINGPLMSATTKYVARIDTTVSALPHVLKCVQDSPLWGASVLNADGPCSILERGLNVVEGNVLITVPKNAKTDRVICYEPHGNIRLQRSVGEYLQTRLAKVGINLRDQSVNQRRAEEASITGHLATIDLRSASDTLAYELVVELLPGDWFELLDSLRSQVTLWPDGVHRENEKFSSMGNGFTFELESLIFGAVASSITPDVSVYGDDIIVPTAAAPLVIRALKLCGFETNLEKTFVTSYFRESCGNDVFDGLNCTPVYLRSLPKKREDVVLFHNECRRWFSLGLKKFKEEHRLLGDWRWLPKHPRGYSGSWRLLQQWRASHRCCLGPQGFGDGHYHVNLDEACPPIVDTPYPSKTSGWEGWWYNSFVKVFDNHEWLSGDDQSGGSPRKDEVPPALAYASLCAATGPKRPRSIWDSLNDRRQFRYRKIRAVASYWPSVLWG